MKNILRDIRRHYAHIHPEWEISDEVYAEMQENTPYYHFDIDEVAASSFRYDEHEQKLYQSRMQTVEITHPEGIHIMRAALHSGSDGFVHIHTVTPFIQFYFACNNNRSYYTQGALVGTLHPGHYQAFVFFPNINTALWTARPNDEFIEINLSLPFFLSCLSEGSALRKRLEHIVTSKETSTFVNNCLPISHEQRQVLHELVQKPVLSTDASQLYVKSKVFHLIALLVDQFDYLGTTTAPEGPRIPESIVLIMHQAKDILDEEINDPPSITELSLRLGTNDNYLKKYFKIIHQCTIRGYINSRRMQIAKDMLLDSERPINEISRFLGYKSMSHFSSHFKKHYGLAPTLVKKRG